MHISEIVSARAKHTKFWDHSRKIRPFLQKKCLSRKRLELERNGQNLGSLKEKMDLRKNFILGHVTLKSDDLHAFAGNKCLSRKQEVLERNG